MGEMAVDRACGIYVDSLNDVPTLYVSFFFRQDSLVLVSVNVPRWSYKTAYRHLSKRFGRPDSKQILRHNGVRLAGWELESGAGLFVNREPTGDLLSWGSILWVSSRACGDGCFHAADSLSLIELLRSL